MTRKTSSLLPVFRGEVEARLLAALLLHPTREATLTELAREIGTNVGNVHGEAERLIEAGILADRRVGRSRLVRDAGGQYSRPLRELLDLAYGPKSRLESALREVPGISAAYLFGSWAARYSGESGPPPNDIDVLVVGSPDRDEVFDRVQQVSGELRIPVQVVFRTVRAWDSADDAFASTLRDRPLVPLDLEAPDDAPGDVVAER